MPPRKSPGCSSGGGRVFCVYGASFAIVTHVLPYAEQHADEAAYIDCTDEAIALWCMGVFHCLR